MEWKKIITPLTDDIIKNLRCGDLCYITGKLLTARDKAHERISSIISAGDELPFELKNEIIYYVGPSPARPGEIIGAAGPTTASRMDPFSALMFNQGIKAMIGKGKRDSKTKELIVENFPVVVAIDMYGEDIYEHQVHRRK